MQLFRHLPDLSDRPSAVAIGNFDGLHLGHKAVIEATVKAAAKHGATPSVLTFEPHPRRFFAPEIPAFRIERVRDKLLRLHDAGVERIFMPKFDAGMASLSPQAFLDEVLGKKLGAKAVITGENFVFGHQRKGDISMLKAWGQNHNVEIVTVSPIRIRNENTDEICSSSAIRAAIKTGNVALAGRLLGHPYRLSGHVVRGYGRGRTIGYPTANLSLPKDLLLPEFGVYAVRASVDNMKFDGVANIGLRPTVAQNVPPTVEIYLFDTLQVLYGKKIEVALVQKIRNEKKFDSVETLKRQIEQDCKTARQILGIIL